MTMQFLGSKRTFTKITSEKNTWNMEACENSILKLPLEHVCRNYKVDSVMLIED